MIPSQSLRSIFRKSQLVIFGITLLMCSLSFILIFVFTLHASAKQNLLILSTSLSDRIEPALVFQDTATIQEILKEYTQQHSIQCLEVYDAQNQLIASSEKEQHYYSKLQRLLDAWFFKEPLKLEISHNQHVVGSFILSSSSEKILEFIINLLFCLAVIMLVMTFAIWCLTNLTYRYIMRSIRPLTETAQIVSDQKAYNLRFPYNSIQEFQELNDVFNQLLKEIQTSHNQLKRENHQLSFQVRHDYLTTLPNRNYFYQHLVSMFNNANSRDQVVLFFIDNNNFKYINDNYGHLAGDAVLIEMAKRLKCKLRHEDFIARLGGDEFAIILESITDIEHIECIAQNLLQSSQEPLCFNGQEIHFSFSLGIAFSKFASNPEELISHADQAMYRAKHLAQHWFIYHL